jgi:hypothetical protein
MSNVRADIQDLVSNAIGFVTVINYSFAGAIIDPPKDTSAAILGASLTTDHLIAVLKEIHALSNQIN